MLDNPVIGRVCALRHDDVPNVRVARWPQPDRNEVTEAVALATRTTSSFTGQASASTKIMAAF
jgi:hypothetical protein